MKRIALFQKALALVVALAITGSSQAAIVITQAGVATNDKPGYTTWTLTASATDGEQIVGFDFASMPAYGFFGPMNQINPAGNSTIFNEWHNFFLLWNLDFGQDSHFNFFSPNLTVPGGFASESSTSLRAVFASSTSLGTSVPFVSLVIPDAAAATVAFTGTVTTNTGGVFGDVPVSGIVPIPEPAAALLTALGAAPIIAFMRHRRHC
jgi:hypothetical protein